MGAEVLPGPLECVEQGGMGMHHVLMAAPITGVLGSKSKQRWGLHQSMTPTKGHVVFMLRDLLHFLEVTIPCQTDQSLSEYFCYAQRAKSISTAGDNPSPPQQKLQCYSACQPWCVAAALVALVGFAHPAVGRGPAVAHGRCPSNLLLLGRGDA